MKFMLMMNVPGGGAVGEWPPWPPQDVKTHLDFMRRLYKDLSEAGELVGAEGLATPAQARLVRVGTGGVPEVTDGPFPEAKEFLAGYWIVDVDTPERAYAIAARASAAPGAGGKPLKLAIEVREVMSMPPPTE